MSDTQGQEIDPGELEPPSKGLEIGESYSENTKKPDTSDSSFDPKFLKISESLIVLYVKLVKIGLYK